MADDVRRSGRANKGHHTKNHDLFDEPPPPPKPKSAKGKNDKKGQPQGARSESTQSGAQQEEEEQEEEEAIIRCVCGDQRDIRGRQMICCDKCLAWQHVKCLGLQEGDHWEDEATTYFCEQCKPEDHVDLLAAMARGEKPWNRKKGSKAAKLKSRPSEVHSEATPASTPVKPEKPEKLSVPKVPTPKTSSTPVQAPAPAPPPPAPTPAPKETPQEAPAEPSNGHAQPTIAGATVESSQKTDLLLQQFKNATPKKQPLSPLGEKRGQDAIVEREVSKPKRRKSSTHAAAHSAQPTTATDPSALPDKQRLLTGKLIETLAAMIKQASDSGKYRVPDGATPSSIATKLALQIDHAAVVHHGEPTDNASPYVLQIRSIVFNAKKNSSLVDRLLSGSLSAEGIAAMAAEEMASEEKQQEYAAMREANEKQMVLTDMPTGPRLRKTHKGEEMVGEEEDTVDYEFRPPERRERDSVHDERPADPSSPNRDGHNVVELPEDVGQHAPLAVDTSASQNDGARRESNFDITQIFNQVRSPQKDQHSFLQRRQSSIRVHDKPQEGPGDDADVDRLLKDEDNDVEMTGYTSDPTIVWQGTLDMQTLGPFDAVARFIAGGDFGQVVPWDQLLSSRLPIQGRIESSRGNDYIQGLATSGTHDVGVLAVSPITPEGRVVMDQLYQYFHPRDRWGVVPVEQLGNEAMRDLYVIPIESGATPLPGFLDMLEYCAIETPRKEQLIILALVAKLPEIKPQFPPTMNFDRYPAGELTAGAVAVPRPTQPESEHSNGPMPPTPNPHGPGFSPIAPQFPPGQGYNGQYPPPQYNNGSPAQAQQAPMYNIPPHHHVPHALEIFGPMIDEPVVKQVLSAAQPPTIDMMLNLRKIVDRVPAARNDMNVMFQHLKAANDEDQQMQG